AAESLHGPPELHAAHALSHAGARRLPRRGFVAARVAVRGILSSWTERVTGREYRSPSAQLPPGEPDRTDRTAAARRGGIRSRGCRRSAPHHRTRAGSRQSHARQLPRVALPDFVSGSADRDAGGIPVPAELSAASMPGRAGATGRRFRLSFEPSLRR